MNNYISLNSDAYQKSAKEFEQKISLRKVTDEKLVPKLAKYFEGKFNPAKMLELGPGSGYIAKLFSDRGHQVDAIEFSLNMSEVVKRTAPKVSVIVDEFLEHDFKTNSYDVILGIAFIHLFPSEDAQKVINKINKLLKRKGMLIISSTLHDEVDEGFIQKSNFSSRPIRYRKKYSREALNDLVKHGGFKILDSFINQDSEGIKDKIWLTLVAEKNNG